MLLTYRRSEYLTIASIVVVMTIWDFVVGVLFGIVISCGCILLGDASGFLILI